MKWRLCSHLAPANRIRPWRRGFQQWRNYTSWSWSKTTINQLSRAWDTEDIIEITHMRVLLMALTVIGAPPPWRLGPEDCTLALPKLWSLLPGLQNLRHLESVWASTQTLPSCYLRHGNAFMCVSLRLRNRKVLWVWVSLCAFIFFCGLSPAVWTKVSWGTKEQGHWLRFWCRSPSWRS